MTPAGRSAATRGDVPAGRSAATRGDVPAGRSAATRGTSAPACGGRGRWQVRADVVVVGTGMAGLVAALAAQRLGRRVLVLSKAPRIVGTTATFYAQGGIAVVLPDGLRDDDDSISAHVADTLAAGGGLCDPAAVESIVADGYRAVADLVADGARFDENPGGRWALTREGGHTRRRIIHAGGDATGAEVQRALDRAAARLDIRPDHTALRVLHDGAAVTGLLVLSADGLGVVHAPTVILATGGLGQLYAATTNPAGSTGDGIALALHAGVPVSDVEFVQFHPTMLYTGPGGGRRPLVTEAIRGEGARLVDGRGAPVTDGVHPMGDLAPRDVVAAAIDDRLRRTGDPCVFLDARHIDGFARKFPTVTAACRDAGVDPTREPIPVVPGAHYSCGGVTTDVTGRTALPGLYAAGEVARTGMHGANRLASNSLLEGLVVGARAGRAAAEHAAQVGAPRADAAEPAPVPVLPRAAVQTAMSAHASVVRDAAGLRTLLTALDGAPARATRRAADAEDAALTLTARAVAVAALHRTESRGCHHRSDHPAPDPRQAVSVGIMLDADGRMGAQEEAVAC